MTDKKQAKELKTDNLVKMMTENPENTPFGTKGSANLIREGGRTIGSGRVASSSSN